jgi:hypothetical protein
MEALFGRGGEEVGDLLGEEPLEGPWDARGALPAR